MMWSSEQAIVLASVFDALNQSKIPWLVLRNYEGLPENNRSKDIDFGISNENIRQVAKIMSDVMVFHGFNRAFTTNFSKMRCTTYFKMHEAGVVSIKVDLMDGFVWRGAHVFDFEQLYSSRVRYRNFFVPNHIDNGVMLLIKPLMIGAGVKPSYVEDILSANSSDSEQFREKLKRTIGQHLANEIWPIIEQKDLAGILSYKRSLSRATWLRAARREPSKTLFTGLEHVYLEIVRRSQRKPASFLAVVGPDGVGKTTFIDLLQKELARLFVKDLVEIKVEHFRPNMLPNLKKLFAGRNYDVSSEEFTNPHRAVPARPLSSIFRLMYYWTDYFLGYWLVTRRKCAGGKMMIFDRYFYDFVIDPRRSRIKLPVWIRRFFLGLTPQPDLVFFLDSDVDTVFARKQELSKDEIGRQLGEFRNLAVNNISRFIQLDARQLPEISCRQALRELIVRSFDRA